MHAQHVSTALDVEIQSFAATLNLCFRNVQWEVVSYYAEHAWQASDRANAKWPEVRTRVRAAWELGVAARSPKGRRVLASEVAPPLTGARGVSVSPDFGGWSSGMTGPTPDSLSLASSAGPPAKHLTQAALT